jgi:hypothetical protein
MAEKHANLKAELYWGLRERFVDGNMAGITDSLLISQLAGIRYKHDARGRVVIESKEDARKRGVRSPDRAEALMLSCHAGSHRAALASAFATASKQAGPTTPVDRFTQVTRGTQPQRHWGARR